MSIWNLSFSTVGNHKGIAPVTHQDRISIQSFWISVKRQIEVDRHKTLFLIA